MIFASLLNLFNWMFSHIVALLPIAVLPDQMAHVFAVAGAYMAIFSWLFPMDTLFQIVVLGVAFEVSVFVFKWSFWLYNKIRGSG